MPSSSPSAKRSEFEERWRRRFAEYAQERDDDAGIAGWSRTGLETRLRYFVRALDAPVRGERWLDAGCGAGTYSRFLAGEGAAVIGIDYSLPTAMRADERGGPGVSYCVADATRLPVRSASFDGVLCLGVTQALAESGRLIASLADAVRPGGQLWVDALNVTCAFNALAEARRRWRGAPAHLRYETPSALRRLFSDCGMTDIRIVWLPMAPEPHQWLQRVFDTAAVGRVLATLTPLAMLVSHSFIVSGRKSGTAAE